MTSGTATASRDAARPRFAALDGLRGVAASVVVIHHFVLLWSATLPQGARLFLDYSPFRLLWAGHEAVLLFFLISGFVLTLPYLDRPPSYPAFLVRRICRIYLPYLAALALALAGAAALHGAIPALGPWFNQTWSGMPTAGLVLDHVAFVGRYPTFVLNTAFWSLIYEMRISILFPLVALIVLRFRAALGLPAVVILSVAALLSGSSPYFADWLITVHFAALFVIGGALARNLDRLRALHERLRPWQRRALAALSFLLVAYGIAIPHLHTGDVTDWLIVPGLVWLLIASLSHAGIARALLSPVPAFLGRISYSLYLVHGTVLFALVHLAYGKIALPWLFLPYVALSLGLATLMQRTVEAPATALGRRLTARRPTAGASAPMTRAFAIGSAGR